MSSRTLRWQCLAQGPTADNQGIRRRERGVLPRTWSEAGSSGKQKLQTCMLRRVERGNRYDLQFLSWNSGGLTSRVRAELIDRLDSPDFPGIDICVIQESHWLGASTFRKGQWAVLSSGTTSTHKAGVVTLVRPRVCAYDQVQTLDLIPGHLQLTVIPWKNFRIQILNVYQRVWDYKLSKFENEQRRGQVNQTLRKQLARIPQRDLLIVSGDFNGRVKTERPWVGPCVLPSSKWQRGDSHTVNKLCRDFSLTVLNTWAESKPATFHNGQVRSQIDFVLMRMSQARRQAKAARAVTSFLVGEFRDGPQHLPAHAQLFVPPYRPPLKERKQYDSRAMDAAYRSNSDAWQRYSVAASQAAQDTPVDGEFWPNANRNMISIASEHFPARATASSQGRQVSSEYWAKQHELLALKRQGRCDEQLYYQLKQETQQEARAYKRLRQERKHAFQEELLLAAQSSPKQQSFQLAQALRKLGPWKPQAKIAFRTASGDLMDSEAELHSLIDYSKRVFCKSGGLLPVQSLDRSPITTE